MNHIESAAARHLPDLYDGIIRPLEMALQRSPALTAVVITPNVYKGIFVIDAWNGNSSYSLADNVVGGFGEMSVDELLGGQQ